MQHGRTEITDRIHKYGGFHSALSKCHIRTLNEPEKPVVIICSQMISNSGTSVTNAVEEIHAQVLNRMREDASKCFRIVSIEKLISKINSHIKEVQSVHTGAVTFALEHLEMFCKFRTAARKIENSVWVEHYPSQLVPHTSSDHYAIVSFDEKTGEPYWNYLSVDEVAELTGYDKSRLIIDTYLLTG